MGQCSTLPSEARSQNTEFGRGHNMSASTRNKQERDDKPTVYHRYKHRDSTMMSDSSEKSNVRSSTRQSRRDNKGSLQVHVPAQGPQGSSNPVSSTRSSRAYAVTGSAMHFAPTSTPEPMQEDGPAARPLSSAKRMRCYKLNLDSAFAGLSSNNVRAEGSLLGPYAQEPPPLTYSGSEDSSTMTDPTEVAIRTAQIFRGITVDRSGTILTQNARATRSNRGNKVKRGEKSRQAAKIDKAKDLVEESIQTGLAPNSKDPANLVSLYIMGEYDEMKYLVRDGANKLRETSQYPDEVLLSFNRTRGASPYHSGNASGLTSPSRKRVSPATPSPSVPRPPMHSTPPKLKGHPRDRPSSRRVHHDKYAHHQNTNGHVNHTADQSRNYEAEFQSMAQDGYCFSPRANMGGSADWSGMGLSRGFNSIWNCGGNAGETGSESVSPTHTTGKDKSSAAPAHPNHVAQPAADEGRNDQHRWDQSAQVRI